MGLIKGTNKYGVKETFERPFNLSQIDVIKIEVFKILKKTSGISRNNLRNQILKYKK